ncbi:uncharacterized protein LOC136712917 [Amia ocellicauda]|uniref:uncharacterized protein LOC136712917 n=1 Tax=Amia ocellicauda TaxID=2972642 RepID=UPI003464E30C
MASEVTTLYLQPWDAAQRNIRFLYLTDLGSFKVCQKYEAEDMMIPLFLGADLFSKTGIRIENHTRFHAKFSKKGLATKLNFSSDFRVHGMRLPSGTNSLWFYSVQGLFRVAFEVYSKQEQLSVLETFQDLWKSRINDGPLNPSYDLSVQLNISEPCNPIEMHNQDWMHRLQTGTYAAQNSYVLESETIAESNPGTPCWAISSISSTVDHNYCSLENGDSLNPSLLSYRVTQKIKSLDNLFQSYAKDMRNEQNEVILLLLDHIEQYVNQEFNENKLADIVLQILNTTYNLTKDQTPGDMNSVYNSCLLSTIGSWLGQQFNVANACISKQIEGFKLSHIDRITDLPPAEELVSQLFPESMKILLMNWMGLSDATAVWKRHSEYPILLLILEFANHNLITGVAHVLYSSLICK